ncbi:MAG: GNAT family N-acetyltransferase [Gammaproteobacteria bacterium]|nr:GNAT family N-acetyltransferase [Gammaproteobacteria bacterium]
MLNWKIKTFDQLTTNELYDLLKLRIDVFVVEQTCYYPDLDNLDRDSQTLHVFVYGEADQQNDMLAYCRVLAPKVVYPDESAIGRVIVAEQARGQKLGQQLMLTAIEHVEKNWPKYDCHISAQQHLSKFYQELGFEPITDMYLEDGIPHIGMLRRK